METLSLSKSARRYQKLLAENGYDFEIVELPDSTRTAADAANTLGCTQAQIIKSLVFVNASTNAAFLVLASGPNRVDLDAISSAIGAPLGKADAKAVKAATGFSIGGIPPVNPSMQGCVLVDEDLLAHDVLWGAAGSPNAVFCLRGKLTDYLPDHKVIALAEK